MIGSATSYVGQRHEVANTTVIKDADSSVAELIQQILDTFSCVKFSD